MSEAKVFLVLPKVLTGTVSGQLHAPRNAPRFSTGSSTCWPETVKYFLRTYGTTAEIRDAVASVYAPKPKVQESELELSTRLNMVSYRWGNMNAEVERLEIVISGVQLHTRTIIALYWESQPRMT